MIKPLHKKMEAVNWFNFNTLYNVNINDVISDVAFETKEGRLLADIQMMVNEDLEQ